MSEERPDAGLPKGRQPGIAAPRLLLRPLQRHDAGAVHRLAGDPEVSATALHIPHPFGHGQAEAWIEKVEAGWRTGRLAAFAAVLPDTGELCGAAGLTMDPLPASGSAELGLWIGRSFWGRGYGYEAALALMGWGFKEVGLRRIHASHLAGNRRSEGILRKLGMREEGVLRAHALHRGEFHDLQLWGILAAEWPPQEVAP